MSRYKHIMQHDTNDCGSACFSMICNYHGLKISLAEARKLVFTDKMGTNILGLIEGGKKVGFDAEGLEGNFEELIDSVRKKEVSLPFIARILTEDNYLHYIVVYKITDKYFYIGDPAEYKNTKMDIETFKNRWLKDIVVFDENEDFKKDNRTHNVLLKYLSFLKSEKLTVFVVIFFSLLSCLINIGGSFLFQTIIDNVVSDNELTFLGITFLNIGILALFVILLYLFSFLLSTLKSFILTKLSKKLSIHLSTDIYRHLVKTKPSFLNIMHSGEYLARFYDSDEIKDVVSITFFSFIVDIIMAVGAFIVLLFISLELSFVVLGILFLYMITIILFIFPLRKEKYEIMKKEGKTISYLKENIDGMMTIKSYDAGDKTIEKTISNYESLETVRSKSFRLLSLENNIIVFLGVLYSIIILSFGSYLMNKGLLTIGALVTFYYLVNYFFFPIERLSELEPVIESAKIAGDRLNDIFMLEEENNVKGLDFPNEISKIEFKDLSFRYGSRRLIFEGLNVKFEGGKKIAIVGSSGSGKTTLARLLMAFYEPLEGDILINEKSIKEYSLKELRKKIAYISQDIDLYSDTIFNNIKMGDFTISNEEVIEACKIAKAHNFIMGLSNDYETTLEERGKNLSGGERQRLSIARALAHKPKILIMDEATSNLDVLTEEGIINAINALNDITIIIIAHRLRTIKYCDYICVINDDGDICYGTHDELIKKNELYSKFFNV